MLILQQALLGRGQLSCDRTPHNIKVDIEITVDQAMPHADDVHPGNPGQFLFAFIRNLVCCLTDNYDTFNKG